MAEKFEINNLVVLRSNLEYNIAAKPSDVIEHQIVDKKPDGPGYGYILRNRSSGEEGIFTEKHFISWKEFANLRYHARSGQ